MCGRFAQVQTRADYLDYFASELEYADALNTVPIGRYNVAPDFRMQGHGRAMIEALKQICKERNATIIDISVRSTEQARSFWEACGAYCEDPNSQLWCIEI
nr:GNAT family N-acetyltransferase [Serratia sp. PAMC26656]MBJ7892548.1 GNAT family N-acetyltransferase [Serratia sp. PAMC26656]